MLGDEGTIQKGSQIRWTPQRVNIKDKPEKLGVAAAAPNAHMLNFFDCIRTGHETNCPFDLGYRVSIACRMAVESYRQQRAVKWDAAREEIV